MVFSNLFSERFIDQVQVVAYLHDWIDASQGGEFIYWDDSKIPKRVPPLPLAGSVIDGSKTIHAAEVYRINAKIPSLNKDKSNVLKYVGNDNWVLYSDQKEIGSYNTNDLRISIVYRARCFENETEATRFANQKEFLSLESILDTLTQDLVARGRLSASANLSKLELAIKLLDEYVAYPYPSVMMPLNYCVLPKVIPSLHAILKYIC